MKEILDDFLNQQHTVDSPFAVTLHILGGITITGIIEGTSDGVVSITRRSRQGSSHVTDEYSDLMRHYSLDHVVGAYFAEGT